MLTSDKYQDEIVSSTPKTKVINTEWTFRPNRPCIVREEFYVSDTCTESHWQLNSPRNKGKVELVGTFTLNLTPWRDDGRMQLRKPAEGEPGKEHYVVQFDIVMELVGRTIRCRAHHPSSGAEGEENGEVTGEMLPHSYVDVSIAAAFEPGTQ